MFVVVGIVGVVDVILAALRGHVLVDFNVLGIFIGRGLWRLSSRARWWALAELWFLTACLALAAVIVCFVDLSVAEKAGALTVVALLGGFTLWQLKILMRDDIRGLFNDPEAKARLARRAVGRRYQFSLASLFVVMLVAGIVATRIGPWPVAFNRRNEETAKDAGGGNSVALADDDLEDVFLSRPDTYEDEDDPRYVRRDAGVTRGMSGGMLSYYHVGYREPKWGRGQRQLLYVVFASAKGELANPVTSWLTTSGSRGSRLRKPGGVEVDLPEAGCQLYEFQDGKYRESNERVTMRQLVGYMRTKPDFYSIDALLEFARAHPDPN